jgi:hypothetical protein
LDQINLSRTPTLDGRYCWDFTRHGNLRPEPIDFSRTPFSKRITTMKITTALLKAADSSNMDAYYDSIVDTMNHYAEVYAINIALRIAHFLSQIGHESGFKIIEENGS